MAITIAITSGSGYFGSTYTQTGAAGAGQWYANETPISGATGNTYVLEAIHEGKKLSFRTASPSEKSNEIHLFVPDDIPGILAWYDASRADLMTLVSTKVSEWISKVGTSKWTQATDALRPTYDVAGRNGKPALLADGTDDYMTNDTPAVFPVGTATSHLFAAAYCSATAAGSGLWRTLVQWGTANAGARSAPLLRDSTANPGVSVGSTATDTFVTAVTWLNTDRIVAGLIKSTGTEAIVDGQYTLAKSSAVNSLAATANRLFGHMYVAGGKWIGSAQDIFWYNTELSTYDRQRVEGYLAHKWGLTGLLPVSHPYKTALPPVGLTATIAGSGLLPTSESVVETNSAAALTISVTSGTGYFGSTYTVAPVAIGQWYAGSTPIPGATGSTYILESKYEGKAITFRAANGRVSNKLQYWTPDMVGSLIGWWDASRADLITLNSTAVVSIASRLPDARTFSQVTSGFRPIYSATARNGKPGIIADGNDDFLAMDSPTVLPDGAEPSTMATVGYFANVTISSWRTLAMWSSSILQRALAKSPAHFVAQGGGSSGTDNISAVNWQNADKIAVGMHDAGAANLYTDGNPTPTTKAMTISGTNQANPYIFASSVTGDRWNGVLQDYCVFAGPLSTFERQKLEGYMASKWGLRALLPVGHPYKASNPPPSGVELVEVGYLPTQNMLVHQHPEFSGDMQGYLPTQSALADTAVPGPIEITLTSGTGYAGSTYTRDSLSTGQWYAGPTPIPGATGMTYVMEAKYEGWTLQFRALNGYRSNKLDLFVPANVPGLLLWLDAYDDSEMVVLTGSVMAWTNRLPGNWRAQQLTEALRPTYNPAGRNGRPAIEANGSGQFFDIITDGAGLPDGFENAHIMAVGYHNNVTINNYRMLLKWGSVASARRGVAKSDLHRVAAIGGNTTTNTVSSTIWQNADRIVSADLQGGLGTLLNVDGGNDIINTNATPAVTAGDAYIFRDQTLYWPGSAQEILIWNRSLSLEERQKVEGYLASKWGLRGNLPSGHPYKSVNPDAGGAVLAGSGYLPTMELNVSMPLTATMTGDGYLPTSAMQLGFPLTVRMESEGLLPTSISWLANKLNITGDFNGYLAEMEAEAELFEYVIEAEMRGFPGESEIGSNGLYKIDITGDGLLAFSDMDVNVPEELLVTSVQRGYLSQNELIASIKIDILIEGAGYLPTTEMEFGLTPIFVTMASKGYLARADFNTGDRPYSNAPGFSTGTGINIGGGPSFSTGGTFRIG